MTRAGKALGVVFGGLVAAAAWAAPPTAMPAKPMTTGAMPAGPARLALADVVDPAYRDATLAVVRKPTIATRSTSDEVVCDPALYEWLLEHPDRVSLAWQRLKVPCLEITDLGNGRFVWVDADGSEVVWQAVGRFKDGVVWYATGKVKASPAAPVVPVRVLVVLTHPKTLMPGGTASITPSVQGYLHTDSRAASTVMRLLGPTAPKLAEQAAEQLLFFFNGIARYVHAHPEKAEELLAPAKR